MLSKRQKELLDYIQGYLEKRGYAPTQREMAGALGVSSLGTLQKHLKHLVHQGLLRKTWNGKRAVELITNRVAAATTSSSLPLLGYVAAGSPIEAISNSEEIEVPSTMIGRGESFVLKVKGDSMIEDGILDGDQVVVRRQQLAHNGQTVVALVDNEATVKRYYKKSEQIELRPANSSMKSIIVKSGQFKIAGVVVGVIRHCN